MKRIIACLVLWTLLGSAALAEGPYAAYSTEELKTMLAQIQQELASRLAAEITPTPADSFFYASNGRECHIRGYKGEDTDVVIPDEIDGVPVTAIEAEAFKGNTRITSVQLPKSLKKIGDSAFSGCTKLASIAFPDTLETIGGYAFMDAGLSGVLILPASLKLADTGSFRRNKLSGLVVLGNSVLEEVSDMPTLKFIYVREGAKPELYVSTMPKLEAAVLSAQTKLGKNCFNKCPVVTVYAPEGSSAQTAAQGLFVPVNTDQYAQWKEYYEALY